MFKSYPFLWYCLFQCKFSCRFPWRPHKTVTFEEKLLCLKVEWTIVLYGKIIKQKLNTTKRTQFGPRVVWKNHYRSLLYQLTPSGPSPSCSHIHKEWSPLMETNGFSHFVTDIFPFWCSRQVFGWRVSSSSMSGMYRGQRRFYCVQCGATAAG